MRVIHGDILAELAASELRPFYLLDLEIGSVHYRYTDCDIPLVLNGATCSPRGFRAEAIRYSTGQIVDSASFSIDDVDHTLKALFVGGTARGEAVTYSLVVLDSNYDLVGPSLVSDANLVAYWKLDETSGQRNDSFGLNHLEDVNTVLYTTGVIGNAALFASATSEYLKVDDNAALSLGADTAFAISAFFHATALPLDGTTRVLVGKRGTGLANEDIEYSLRTYNGKLYFRVGNGTTYAEVATSGVIAVDTTYHVVAWHDPDADYIYLQLDNGTIYSTAWSGGTLNSDGDFCIGSRSHTSPGYYWDGWVDELGFWKGGILTADERAQLYNSGAGWTYPFLSSGVTLFEGVIDGWDADETDLNLQVASIATQWSQRTLAAQSASCRWKVFKGTECAYSGGATWCDRTYTRCSALGNTANFGGFRWLPSIMDKEIWWGRAPK